MKKGNRSKQFISLALVVTFIGMVVFSGYAYEPKSNMGEDVGQTQNLENEQDKIQSEKSAPKWLRYARRVKRAIAGIRNIKPDQEFIDEAKELGLAPGQYKMIKVLQALDPNIAVDEYKDLKVFEIIKKINELAKDSSVLESLDEETKAIIEKSQEAAKGAEIRNGIRRKRAIGDVHNIKPDQEFLDEAKELGLAPGKYKMIKVLQALDPNITVDEYKDAKAFEIIKKINELAKDSSVIENLDEETKAIIKKAQEVAEKNQAHEANGKKPRGPKSGQRNKKANNGAAQSSYQVSPSTNSLGKNII